MNVGCYFISTRITHASDLVVEMHQIEHNRRMGADFQVLKGQFEELFNMSILQSQANQIKSHHKRPMGSNQNKMVFFLEQKGEGKNLEMWWTSLKKFAFIHFNAPPPTLP